MSKPRVFVDTNVILEAFRTNTWKAICHNFAIETVEKCVEETLTGNQLNPRYTPVDRKILIEGLTACHQVTKQDIAKLILSQPGCQGLDDGELHLFAWLNAHEFFPNALLLISTADKAAIVAADSLGWLASVECLEKLLLKSGVTKTQRDSIARHFCSDWLDKIKMKIRLKIF